MFNNIIRYKEDYGLMLHKQIYSQHSKHVLFTMQMALVYIPSYF